MQHLENDMDELFQRAAENYPLKKGDGDWESVAKRIADKSEPAAVLAATKNNGTKKIIALFLLLFIGTVSWFVIQHYQQRIDSKLGKNLLANNSKKAKSKISEREKSKEGAIENNTFTVAGKEDKTNQNKLVGFSGSNADNEPRTEIKRPFSSNAKKANTNIEKDLTGEPSDNGSAVAPDGKFSPEENINQNNDDINSLENKTSTREILSENKEKEKELKPGANADNEVAQNKKKKNKAAQNFQKRKGIYAGVVAGPDFSKVHSGSFDRSGVNAGIVAGYRFSNKVSIESGISWDKKHYTSEGKNFRMDRMASTMPSGMVINDLESSNSFIEIPLKLKFDFFTKRNSNLFVSGGVSAYIITREQNMYHVTYNGDNKNLLSVYEKNNYGLPAVVNLSAGFEKNIFKKFDIRIEPYLKIPLRGMGVGSLPITSAGLQIGIIGRLK